MAEIESTDPAAVLGELVKGHVESIKSQLNTRSFRAASELTNQVAFVLRGQRSGRTYRIPHSKATYQASAPGEAPANRTGTFRSGWQRRAYSEQIGNTIIYHACTQNGQRVAGGKLLGRILEEGAPRARILPRPYKEQIINRAKPAIQKIYSEPFQK